METFTDEHNLKALCAYNSNNIVKLTQFIPSSILHELAWCSTDTPVNDRIQKPSGDTFYTIRVGNKGLEVFFFVGDEVEICKNLYKYHQ